MHVADIPDFTELPTHPLLRDIRKHKGKFDYAQFIGWDGEGVTDSDGHHHYILFKSSKGHTLKSTTDIRTVDAFAILIQAATENPKAIHVIYYGSYDMNMILKDIPIETLKLLAKGKRAYFGQYNIQVFFKKQLWIKDRTTGKSVTLWDIGSFYQQSFVSALETWGIDVSFLSNIAETKLRRSFFTLEELTDIEEYCSQELEALVLLINALHKALNECNLRINRWYGPGAVAAHLYKKHGIKHHLRRPPEEVNYAAQCAYGGGRIELIKQGHSLQPIYYYDIRSAYPSGITNLPSLAYSSWEYTNNPDPEIEELSLYHVSNWSFNDMDTFHPLRHRNTTGDIIYPSKGTGVWVWTPEHRLLREFYRDSYEVTGAYIFKNDRPAVRPFNWVSDLYTQRQQWKQEGRAAQHGLKLSLNSLYGKMIQQKGWKEENGKLKLPVTHQLEYGGYVTSLCREQLYRAALTNTKAIIGFETDGIITDAPLDIPLGDGLGDWECTEYTGITYIQNGFYFLHSGDHIKAKYRGFDKGTIRENDVLTAWRDSRTSLDSRLTRHYGLPAALHQNHMDRWGDWLTEQRELSLLVQTKRIPWCERGPCTACSKGLGKHQALHDTQAYGYGKEESAPYPLEWKNQYPDWKREIDEYNNIHSCDYDAADLA